MEILLKGRPLDPESPFLAPSAPADRIEASPRRPLQSIVARRARIRVAVALHPVDGEVLEGTVFVNPDQRAGDLVNAGTRFLAFERRGGVFELIAKRVIARVRPFDEGHPYYPASAEGVRSRLQPVG